ncbi:hypothetical protein HK405_009431, partial [Cladochytrium tenue]
LLSQRRQLKFAASSRASLASTATTTPALALASAHVPPTHADAPTSACTLKTANVDAAIASAPNSDTASLLSPTPTLHSSTRSLTSPTVDDDDDDDDASTDQSVTLSPSPSPFKGSVVLAAPPAAVVSDDDDDDDDDAENVKPAHMSGNEWGARRAVRHAVCNNDTFDRFDVLTTVGYGSNGAVVSARPRSRDAPAGVLLAIKIIYKSKATSSSSTTAAGDVIGTANDPWPHEVLQHRRISAHHAHPGMLHSHAHFQDERHFYLVMDLVDADWLARFADSSSGGVVSSFAFAGLWTWSVDATTPPGAEANPVASQVLPPREPCRAIFRDVALALRHLHSATTASASTRNAVAASAAEKGASRRRRSRRRFIGTVVLANKQDLTSAMPAATIEETLRKAGMDDFDAPWTVVPTSVISGDGLWDSLAWLQDEKDKLAREEEGEARAAAASSSANSATRGLTAGFNWLWRSAPDARPASASLKATPAAAAAVQDPAPAPAYSTLSSPAELAALIDASSDHGVSSAEFRGRFARGDLDRFDHRAHLRAGYLVLLLAAQEGKRDSEATELFLHALKTFIALAGNRVRNTFHVTMSIFWCTVLQLAIQSERHSRFAHGAPDLDDDSFPEFLAAQPQVMFSGLWRRYYCQTVLMTRDAASGFVVPDLRPLPTYIVLREAAGRLLDDALLAPAYTEEASFSRGWMSWVARGVAMLILAGKGSDSGQSSSAGKNSSAGQSIALFREKEIAWTNEDAATFSAWSRRDLDGDQDEELLQRIVYFSVRKGVLEGVRRVKDLFDDLKTSGERTGRRYPETQVYLTVQLFTAGLHTWKLTVTQSPASTSASPIATSAAPRMLSSYRLFKLVFPNLCDREAWRPYYSKALWTSVAARDAFVPPDLRDRLPDTVELDGSIDSRLKSAIASAMAAGAESAGESPAAANDELRKNFMALLSDYDASVASGASAVDDNSGGKTDGNTDDADERFLSAVAEGTL